MKVKRKQNISIYYYIITCRFKENEAITDNKQKCLNVRITRMIHRYQSKS